MTDRKSVHDKVETLSADIAETVQDLMHEAKPMLHRVTDRMTDRVSELAHQGMNAACEGEHRMESKAHDLTDHAAHMIRHEPFKAMLIAAGIGAAAVALVGLMSRPHPHSRVHSH